MSINRKIIITVAVGLVFGISSCRKFFNVNQNPNQSATATVQTLLPAAELYVASTVGVDLQINGSIWGEYWTQDPGASQYRSVEQYAPGQDYFSTPWLNLYKAGENFYQLGILADTGKKKQYKAIALIMKAYTFQLITDAWGDAPYTQALKGQPVDSNVTNPKYDSQRVIYNSILANIDSALKLINPSDAVLPGNDDLIYGGDMVKWRKFANTLKLRIYLRMSAIDPITAQAGIATMYAANPAFIGNGDDAKIAFGYTASSKSPLYAEASSTTLAGIQNLVGSKTCIDSLNADNDYRLFIFYEATSSGSFTGIAQGNYDAVVAGGSFSLPSPYVAGDANNAKSANAPVNLLTSYESYFLQAEAFARGWATTGLDDSTLFYQGIYANFNYYSSDYTDLNITWQDTTGLYKGRGYVLPSGDTLKLPVMLTASFAYYSYLYGDTTYLTTPAIHVPAFWSVYKRSMPLAQRIKTIITQKWFCMCGNQGFEAWCEQRRTGYPDFFVISQNSLIGNNLPKRFLYPTSESTRNANFPGVAPITAKMWWDLF
ncbi:MAG: SusD/RagB family nutrient-binding outer membrane lipoprotein [Chitinophagales bacterium]